jgi:hypothetical protein
MLLFNYITKSVGVCSVFNPENTSWLGGPFGGYPSDSFSTKKKINTRRIKASSFDFDDNLKIF